MERNEGISISDGPVILAMGPGWLAVEKPGGMSVHNSPGRDLCARVLDGLRRDSGLAEEIGWDPAFGVHPAHRLDGDTSGVMLLGCRRDTLHRLAAQFEAGTVAKRYHAIVHGRIDPTETKQGWRLWDRPLSPDAQGRRNPAGPPPRKPCRTRYRVLDNSLHYTLLACEPLTGRKHQIRRHAVLAGHPVAGDRRYASGRSLDFLSRQCGFQRLGLHAVSLAFTAPENGRSVTVRATPLPPEMARLLENDRQPKATPHPPDKEAR